MSQTDDTRPDDDMDEPAATHAETDAPMAPEGESDEPTAVAHEVRDATDEDVDGAAGPVEFADATGSNDDDAGRDGDGDGDEPERLYTKSDVARIEAEAQERLLRVMAEYDNFRRRTAREKEKWSAAALERFVKDLLPVFDSFEKARTVVTDDIAVVREGLDVVHKQLAGVLARNEIEVLDPVGETFDPELHEALMRQPSDEHAPGTVVTVFERGYKIGPRLLRPARTVVADEQ